MQVLGEVNGKRGGDSDGFLRDCRQSFLWNSGRAGEAVLVLINQTSANDHLLEITQDIQTMRHIILQLMGTKMERLMTRMFIWSTDLLNKSADVTTVVKFIDRVNCPKAHDAVDLNLK